MKLSNENGFIEYRILDNYRDSGYANLSNIDESVIELFDELATEIFEENFEEYPELTTEQRIKTMVNWYPLVMTLLLYMPDFVTIRFCPLGVAIIDSEESEASYYRYIKSHEADMDKRFFFEKVIPLLKD